LAAKIGALSSSDATKRRVLAGIPERRVRRILPVLVVQDHALRGLSFNWWLNRRFGELMSNYPLRAGIEVLPLNVVNIEDLETLVESSDGEDFDFVYALHNKAVRDPEMKCQLHNFLFNSPGYGNRRSKRWTEVYAQLEDEMFGYMFPNEWKCRGDAST
jgi:hypothetical protein